MDIISSQRKLTLYCLVNLCVLWFWLWTLIFFIEQLLSADMRLGTPAFVCHLQALTTHYLTWRFEMHTVSLRGTSNPIKGLTYHFSSRFSASTYQFFLLLSFAQCFLFLTHPLHFYVHYRLASLGLQHNRKIIYYPSILGGKALYFLSSGFHALSRKKLGFTRDQEKVSGKSIHLFFGIQVCLAFSIQVSSPLCYVC